MKLTENKIKLSLKALWLIALTSLFKGKNRNFKQTMAIFYQLIVKAAIFLPLFLIVAQSLMDVFHDKAVFLPFKTPPALNEQGYSGEVFVEQIANQIASIRRDVARSDKENFIDISVFNESENMEIPGAGISLSEVTDFLRTFFGGSIQRISGSVVTQGEKMSLTVTITGKPSAKFRGDFDRLDAMIRDAAIYILKNLDPVTLGKYYFIKKDREKILEVATYVRANYVGNKELVIAQLIEGLYHFQREDYQEALYEWRIAAKNDPENVNAFLYQGWALKELGRFAEAVEAYRKVVEIDPYNPGAYNSWAIALYNMCKSEAAIGKLKKLVKIMPDYAKAYNSWGYFLFEQRKYDEAIEQIRHALSLNPQSDDAYYIWAEALSRMEEYDDAYLKYETALKYEKLKKNKGDKHVPKKN